MAFDQSTRNRLARFVSDTRSLLAEEFTRQLQNVYGLDPDTGDVTDPARLTLDNAQRETAQLLRETMEHYLASADTSTAAKAKKARQETLDRIVREQAFTVLNRLCALRMAEARGLLIESIANGYQSKGFQLYQRLAGTALGETGDCYRVFVFSVFDEFAVDLPVLFDRFSPQGRLFPRETALLAVLNEINHADIDPLWAEDETIGWIYQYFNSVEERRQMRAASQAPRNSRELAVRNQFFTPRYVVEFLTDNTLGRIWYEMTQGATALKDSCRYLVRRFNEIFLAEYEVAAAPLPFDEKLDNIIGDPREAYQRVFPQVDCKEYSPPAGWVKEAYGGDFKNLPRDGSDPDTAWVAAAISPKQIEALIGEQWQPMEDNTKLSRLTQSILDGNPAEETRKLPVAWAIISAYARSNQYAGGYERNGRRKLWGYFRHLAQAWQQDGPQRDDVSQEELLKQPVHIPHRALKDPRDIKMLDPACGSMHFGLYAFDLFERIYHEAWDLEAPGRKGPDAFVRPEGLKPLHETYDSKEAFLRDVPRLIIERNIHGIDIDPRAVQIAGLSLWLRAQRSWQNQNVKAQDRPQIQRSNIVCAEPMPGEADMLEEFLKGLRDDRLEYLIRRVLDVPENQQVRATARMAEALCDLVRTVWKEMELAGEAGSLLKIEESLADAITKGKEEWVEKAPLFRVMEFGLTEETQANPKVKYYKSVPGEEEDFWNRAEAMVLAALHDYAEHAAGSSALRTRMFVRDAAQGFAFIDACRKRFDVSLMNPPFGDVAICTRQYIAQALPEGRADIGMAFITRFASRLVPHGRLGAITNRVFLANDSLDEWRQHCLLGGRHSLEQFLDLGYGVLDGALVEAAAYVVSREAKADRPALFARVLDERSKEEAVVDLFVNGIPRRRSFVFHRCLDDFDQVPGHVIAYQLPRTLLNSVLAEQTLSERGASAAVGLQPSDDFRFVRLAWEVPSGDIGKDKHWPFYAKGGEYNPYWDDIHLVVNWHNDGREIRNFYDARGKLRSRPQNRPYYFRRGVTYPERTTSDFSPRVLPKGTIFSVTGQGVFCGSPARDLAYIAGAYSRPFKLLIDAMYGSGDCSVPGSAATHYRSGLLARLPVPIWSNAGEIDDLVKTAVVNAIRTSQSDETSRYFHLFVNREESLPTLAIRETQEELARYESMLECNRQVERHAIVELGFEDQPEELLDTLVGPHPLSYDGSVEAITSGTIAQLWGASESELMAVATERHGARRQLTKKAYVANRRLELVAHITQISASVIAEIARANNLLEPGKLKDVSYRLLSYCVGCVFGRWSAAAASDGAARSIPEDVFAPLPAQAPASSTDGAASPSVLVDDVSSGMDIVRQVSQVMHQLFDANAAAREQEVCDGLGRPSLRELFSSGDYFQQHLSLYSKSRRAAPIYWPLSTPSNSYTLWLYYHRLTDQMLYTCVNDFVDPKLKQVSEEASRLRGKSNRSSAEEKELERLSDLELELKDFRDELLRIAKFWKPNLNDGVQITASPLWKLLQHRQWQNRLKETWEKLEAGEYDWAHLALSIWPDRVVRASHADRSYAIAHGLEEQLWHEVEVEKTGRGGRVTTTTEWQPRDLSEEELNQIIAEVKQR